MERKSLVKDIENKKIEVKYIDKPIPLDKQVKDSIEEYWKTVNNIFRRGKIFVVKDIIENDDKIDINIYFSDYAHYIYTKRHTVDNNNICNNLWAGIVLETSDNKYLFGEMSEVTATAGEYHISGGSCDEEDLTDNYMDYKKTMFRELKEEFNLESKDLKSFKMKYLKLPSKKEYDIGILYKGILNKTAKQIEEEYNKYLQFLKDTKGEIEFKRLVFVDKNIDKIKEFIKINKNILMDFTEDMLLEDINDN